MEVVGSQLDLNGTRRVDVVRDRFLAVGRLPM